MKIYHNPACSTCQKSLCLLEEKGAKVEAINYLETPPTRAELVEIIEKLGIAPLALVRQKGDVFNEKYLGKTLSDEAWIDAMVADPILIQRPIVINGNQAVIGRPPSTILTILK